KLRIKIQKRQNDFHFSNDDINTCVTLLQNTAMNLVPLPSMKNLVEAKERSEQFVKTVLQIVATELGTIQDKEIDLRFISSLLV
ncbi:MAG: hypothetical protein O2897_06235, partial [bacterium]|nr:hypothetical protein [bacterium]